MEERNTVRNWDWPRKYFDIRMAIVEVKPWESDGDAWRRHVKDRPRDIHARIRVFHREEKETSTVF